MRVSFQFQSPYFLTSPIYSHREKTANLNVNVLQLFLMAETSSSGLGLGSIELYGSNLKHDTIVDLRPGEWIRIRGTIVVHRWPSDVTPITVTATLDAGHYNGKAVSGSASLTCK